MIQADYSSLIISLFKAYPDCYNTTVPKLLRRLKSSLSSSELEEVLKTAQHRLRDTEAELSHEFDLLLMEHGIEEGLRDYKTMDVMGAAYELILLGVELPKSLGNKPDQSGWGFWMWFETLPESLRSEVWEKAGYPMTFG